MVAELFTPEEEKVLYEIRYHLAMAENGFQQLLKIKLQARMIAKTRSGV